MLFLRTFRPRKSAKTLVNLQSSYIYHYTLLILLGSSVILGVRQSWFLFSEFIDYKILFIFLSVGMVFIKEKFK